MTDAANPNPQPLADAIAGALSRQGERQEMDPVVIAELERSRRDHPNSWTISAISRPSDCACRFKTQLPLTFAGQRWLECSACGNRVCLGEHDSEATEPADAEAHESDLFGGGQGRSADEINGCATRAAMAIGLIALGAWIVALVCAVLTVAP